MFLKSFIFILILLNTISAAKQPNILFIAIDDLRPELGCYGAAQVKTPHIDKLAASAMRFERAYCQVPICMGSRASLMTGILPTSKRFVGDCRMDVDTPQAMTMPEAFRKAGYTTISNGKIYHNQEDAADRSWSEKPWQPRDNMRSHDPETTRLLSKTKKRGRIYELPDVADSAYPDGETAQKTIQDLQRLKHEGKPFFLACGFLKPHMPFYAPKKYWDLYPRESIKLAPNRQRPDKAPAQLKGSSEFLSYYLAGMDPHSDEFHRIMRHGYLACTSYADKVTGDVLAELDRLGLTDNTIVVLWGDHGWHLGEHNFWGKHNTMHLATRVPLIVRVPGKKPCVSSSLVETTDLFPSLCALAGIVTPPTVQGRDFTTLLDNPNQPFHKAAFSRFLNADCVITDQFSYTSYDNGKVHMLYHLTKDPQENQNIADDPKHEKTVVSMKKLLKERMEQAKR